MPTHYQIADLLADNFEDVTKDLDDTKKYRTIFNSLFLNFRMKSNKPHGLYLTNTGFELLSKITKCYDIPMPDGYRIKMADRLALDNMCSFPYYFKGTDDGIILYVFEDELATVLKLNDGNIIQAQEMLFGPKKFLKQG